MATTKTMSGKEKQSVMAVEEIVESEPLMDSDSEFETHHQMVSRHRSTQRTIKVHYLLNVVLTLMVICLTAIIFVRETRRAPPPSVDSSQCRPNFYSPAHEATWTGSKSLTTKVTKDTPSSHYTHGTLENMDSNWTALLRVGMMGLTDEELAKVGGSTDSIRLPPESGGGYMSYLASHHHLHCLYLLHQSLYPEWYETRSVVWNLSAKLRRSHWDHCIDELREYVMCNADTTVVTYDWVDEVTSPMPQQGNPRVCANWDGHFQWQLDRQVPTPKEQPKRPW